MSAPLRSAMVGFVAEAHQLIRAERQRGICPAGVVTEFHFIDAGRQGLYNGPDLTPKEPFCGNILQQGHHGE